MNLEWYIFFVVCAMASMKSIYTHLTVYMFGLLSTITWHKEYFIRQAWRQIWSDCQETYKNVIAYEKVCNANPAWLIKLVYQPVLPHGLIRINIRMRSIIIIIYFTPFSFREHIRCKPSKLCKLQSGSPDQHPRGMWGLGNFIINCPPLDSVIILLQIPSSTPSVSPFGCWSGGSDWNLHDLHEDVGLHLYVFFHLLNILTYTLKYIYLSLCRYNRFYFASHLHMYLIYI